MIFSRVLASPLIRFRSRSSQAARNSRRVEQRRAGIGKMAGDGVDVLAAKQGIEAGSDMSASGTVF